LERIRVWQTRRKRSAFADHHAASNTANDDHLPVRELALVEAKDESAADDEQLDLRDRGNA
jgi:hypothetical protein